jgi:RHS repeat-associated protein
VPSPSSSTANFKLQTPNSSYTFSAKERDVETGLSYFGARYYSSDLSIWLSVDPMSDKYPNESPYVYCGNAPILLKDPNGREKINAFGKHNKTHSDASNRYKDNVPVIHLWAHGNNKMMQTFNPKTDEPQFVRNADDMHAFLCEHSDIYQSNSDNNKTSILVLHSCQTGKGENNIAQQLSSELDLLVVAPSENVYNRTQNAGTAQEFTCEIGVNSTYTDKNGKTQVGKRGSWNIYYKGIMVDSFDGHTKPNFKDPQKIIDKYEKKYQKIMSTDQ